MAQITGKAIIRVNGTELRSLDEATLNPGGATRPAVKGGGKVYGYKEETVEPKLEFEVAHTKDTSLIDLGKITGATVIFETDTGDSYVLREAWTAEVPSLKTSGGTVPMVMSAVSCERM